MGMGVNCGHAAGSTATRGGIARSWFGRYRSKWFDGLSASSEGMHWVFIAARMLDASKFALQLVAPQRALRAQCVYSLILPNTHSPQPHLATNLLEPRSMRCSLVCHMWEVIWW